MKATSVLFFFSKVLFRLEKGKQSSACKRMGNPADLSSHDDLMMKFPRREGCTNVCIMSLYQTLIRSLAYVNECGRHMGQLIPVSMSDRKT